MKIGQRYIRMILTAGILSALLLTGCMGDEGDCTQTNRLDGKSYLTLTFVTPNDGTATRAADNVTRAAANDPDGYEAGIGYEDYINLAGGDYKIYFFTYASNDTNGGTLIAEFKPESTTSTSDGTTTTYTITGSVPEALLAETDFRIVMLANWGWWYPGVTEGKTTIDDLCEGTNTTFNAYKKFVIDADNLIPFYGVQEYTNVTFASGTTTTLGTPISLLRAVAKVEVILTPDESVDDEGNANSNINEFSNVSIVNYNSQGYCAPWGVYMAADYDTSASKNPDTTDWSDEWVAGLHLVEGANDTGSKSQDFTHISGHSYNSDGTTETYDTWRIYLPEYDNMGEDYCYIQVYVDGDPFTIYFADYTDGTTDNSLTTNRYNLKRNNLYRFYVTVEGGYLRVHVNKWEDTYENEFTYGEETTYIPDGDNDGGGEGDEDGNPD